MPTINGTGACRYPCSCSGKTGIYVYSQVNGYNNVSRDSAAIFNRARFPETNRIFLSASAHSTIETIFWQERH
jgi:hypothetical protein